MPENWYILRDEKRFGPYTGSQMKKHAASGQLLPIDLVIKDGITKPFPAGKVKGLFPTAPVQAAFEPPESETDGPKPRSAAKVSRSWIILGVGVAAVAVVAVVALIFAVSGKKSSPVQANQSAGIQAGIQRGNLDNKIEPSNRPSEPTVDLPDFSKVDYSLDTSKLNYEQGPNGEKLIIAERGSRDGPEAVTGFKDSTGKFIEHGVFAGRTHEGQPRCEIDIYLGKEHGKSIEYYPSGKIRKQGFVKDDETHGKWIEFYETGEKKSESYYLNGKAHGPYVAWFRNGNKKTELTYVHDEKHGPHTEWYENGHKAVSTPYKHGKLHGTMTTWNDQGRELVRVRFHEGRPDFKPASEKRETFGLVIDLLRAGGAAEKLEDWLQAFGKPDSGFNESAIPKASNLPASRQTWIYHCRDGKKELQVRVSVGLGSLTRDEKGKAKFNGVTVVIIDRMRDL